MVIYLGPEIYDWIEGNQTDIIWLHTAPLVGEPSYPVIFDIVESAQSVLTTKLMDTLYSAMAPRFEEVGIDNAQGAKVEENEITYELASYDNSLLISAAVDAVSSLDSKFGIVLHNPEQFDDVSYQFFYLLLQTSNSRTLNLAIESPVELASSPIYRKHITDLKIVKPQYKRRYPLVEQQYQNSIDMQIVSLCPQGIPKKTMKTMIPNYDKDCIKECLGPLNEPWLFLSDSTATILKKSLPRLTRRKLHSMIFDNWEPNGWGYLRKAYHGICSNDKERMMSLHGLYLIGMKEFGESFLYDYYHSLSKSNKSNYHTKDNVFVQVAAARLARRLKIKHSDKNYWSPRAYTHYENAIRLCDDSLFKVTLMWELANFYANHRDRISLKKSRRWYNTAFKLRSKLANMVLNELDRVETDTKLHNGLAFVEYLEGNNSKALYLEQLAKHLVERVAQRNPQLSESLLPLIYYNLAQLYYKRFSDSSRAITLLYKSIAIGPPLAKYMCRMFLAEIYFNKSQYSKVIELLEGYFEKKNFFSSKMEEILSRTLFIISLLLSYQIERARKQLDIFSDTYTFEGKGIFKILEKAHKLILNHERSC